MAFVLPSDTEDEPAKKSAPSGFRLPSDIEEQAQAATAPPTEAGGNLLSRIMSDIPSEVGKSVSANVSGAISGLSPIDRAEKGVIGGTLEAGKGLLHSLATVPEAIQAPLRSVIGHPMANATRWTGRALGKSLEHWFPDTEAGELGKRIAASAEADDPRKLYEKTAEDATTALSAGRPTGFTTGVKSLPQGRIAGPPRPVSAGPTQQIFEISDNLFDQFRRAGINVKRQGLFQAIDDIRKDMNSEDFFDVPGTAARGAFQKLTRLQESPRYINPSGHTDVGHVHSVIKDLKEDIRATKNNREKEALGMAMNGLMNYLTTLPTKPGNLVAGPLGVRQASRAVEDLQRATALWHIGKRSEEVEEVIRNAYSGAKVSGSGANIENKLRQGINSILSNRWRRWGFEADEIEAMQKIIGRGTTGEMLRLLGKMAPSGVISGVAGLEIAHLLGAQGPSKFLPGAIGLLAKQLAEARKAHQVEELTYLIKGKATSGATMTLPEHLDWRKRRIFDPRVMGPFLEQFREDEDRPFLRDAQGRSYFPSFKRPPGQLP